MECPKVFVSVGSLCLESVNPVDIYMFKVNNRNSKARSEICSKLAIKTPEQGH